MNRKMKDSGMEWIGEIPEGWELTRLSSIFIERKEKVSDRDFAPLSVTKQGILPQIEGVAKTDNGDCRKRVAQGDFVINSRSDRKGSSGVSQHDGSVSLINIVLQPSERVRGSYIHHLLRSYAFQEEFYRWGHGIVDDLWTTNSNDAKNILLPIPSADEQQRIADFLDTQTAEIDASIAKTQESIEEYKKLKQAVITQAVTKGIRPGRAMKDSGVEWIGDVPEEWRIVKAKYLVRITHGTDPVTSGEIPVYGSGADSFKTCGEYKEGPAVLIGRKGATLHIPHYIQGRYWNVDTAFDVKAINDFSLKYYYYLATSFDYPFYRSQTTLPSMTQRDYLNMPLPHPRPEEQQEIAAYLDEKCAAIDTLIEKKQSIITELESYKKSLIYEYVTGKKEVPTAS